MLKQVSGERLHHELDLILAEEHAASMLARLAALEILPAIHPELAWVPGQSGDLPVGPDLQNASGWNLPDELAGLTPLQSLRYLIWLGPLPGDRLSVICQRLKLHGGLVKALFEVNHLLRDLPTLPGMLVSQIARRLDKISLLAIFAVYRISSQAEERDRLRLYATSWRNLNPTIDGHSLEKRGLAPSPAYRLILNALRDAWLDGKVTSAEQERDYLDGLVAQYYPPAKPNGLQ